MCLDHYLSTSRSNPTVGITMSAAANLLAEKQEALRQARLEAETSRHERNHRETLHLNAKQTLRNAMEHLASPNHAARSAFTVVNETLSILHDANESYRAKSSAVVRLEAEVAELERAQA